MCDEKINDGKECPYHWLGPKKEIEWYNELVYSNIPVASNYDMQQLKKLFIKTETGLLSSRGNTFFSLSQESHGVNCTDDDDNNDDDVHVVFQNVTSNTSSNAYTRLKMHFSHICTMCDNNEDAIKFVEEKFEDLSSSLCRYLITQNPLLKPNEESSIVSSSWPIQKKRTHKKQKIFK